MDSIVNLLHEIGMLAAIPRSGFAFLGSGQQSVAEHSFRVSLIAYSLAALSLEEVDRYKLLMMCLLHDLPESRVGDLNYVQKKYVQADLGKVLEDIKAGSPLGPQIVEWIQEYEEGASLEAKLAHDADQLELLLVLKHEQELGNPRTARWIENCRQRLSTPVGKLMAENIMTTPTDRWWKIDMST